MQPSKPTCTCHLFWISQNDSCLREQCSCWGNSRTQQLSSRPNINVKSPLKHNVHTPLQISCLCVIRAWLCICVCGCPSVYLRVRDMYRDTCKRIREKIVFASKTGVCWMKPRCVGYIHLHGAWSARLISGLVLRQRMLKYGDILTFNRYIVTTDWYNVLQ